MITQERSDQREDNTCAQEQLLPVLPAGSIYSDEERLVLGPWQKVRQRLLSPTILLVFFGFCICWVSSTIARYVYPPPKRWASKNNERL